MLNSSSCAKMAELRIARDGQQRGHYALLTVRLGLIHSLTSFATPLLHACLSETPSLQNNLRILASLPLDKQKAI